MGGCCDSGSCGGSENDDCQTAFWIAVLIMVIIIVILSLVIALVLLVVVIQKWLHKLLRAREWQLLVHEYEVVEHERNVSTQIQAVYHRQIMDIVSDLTAESHKPPPEKSLVKNPPKDKPRAKKKTSPKHGKTGSGGFDGFKEALLANAT